MDLSNQKKGSGEGRPRTPVLALKVIVILLGLVAAETIGLAWLFMRGKPDGGKTSYIFQLPESVNIVQNAFPEVDFSNIYPDLSGPEIDQLQRECFGVRYVYKPFVQFEPVPQQKRFVSITATGYRKGWRDQPWPPATQDLVVFVFGGSTTFSYGLPDNQTLPVRIESALSEALPDAKVQCYNFGRGYYFSTQEKLLFESLLLQGIIPDMAVFIDGLNDFYYDRGEPQLTDILYHFMAPDLPRPPVPPFHTKEDIEAAVAGVVNRYRNNLKMIAALAEAYEVAPVFIAQPVPFLDFPLTPKTYPFPAPFDGHELCAWGYGRFKEAALSGRYGDYFIWCGDAFSQANAIVYADSIHYSNAGAQMVAQLIVERALENGLVPRSDGNPGTGLNRGKANLVP